MVEDVDGDVARVVVWVGDWDVVRDGVRDVVRDVV